jgi:prevent-host-death family protein
MAKKQHRARAVREPASPLPASQFKARCLELMDYVRDSGREIVITKHGEPVAKLVPVAPSARDIFGYLKGTVTYHGDIVAPTGERWNAEED